MVFNNSITLQFGQSSFTMDNVTTVTLPIGYVSTYHVFTIIKDGSRHGASGICAMVCATQSTLTQCKIVNDYYSGSGYGDIASWFTIGY